MPANKKISEFDEVELDGGPGLQDFLGGYRDEGLGSGNPNIKYNMLAYTNWLLSQVSAGNAGKSIVSGGVSYTGTGLDFTVSVRFIYFDLSNVNDPSPLTADVTLNNGDATHPRFDLFVVEVVAGVATIEVVEGTPAADPAIPYPAENQIAIQPVLVAAGATVPSITQTTVYANDDPGEWGATTYDLAGSGSGSIDLQSTDDPYEGTYCLEASLNDPRGIRFSGSAISFFEYPFLTFFVRLPEVLSTGHRLLSSVGYSGNGVGNVVDFMALGLDRTIVDEWQQIVVPTSLYNVTVNDGQIDRIHLRMDAPDLDETTFFLDFITFSTGIPTPPPATPSWAQVLGVDPNSGANSPVINAGQTLNFDTVAGTIINWFGGYLVNVVGNLLFKTAAIGPSADGTTLAARLTDDGEAIADTFYQNDHLEITSSSNVLTWNWRDGDLAKFEQSEDVTTFTLTNLEVGVKQLKWLMNTPGGYAIDWGDIIWPDDTEPTAPDAGEYVIVSLSYDTDADEVSGTWVGPYTAS